MFYASDAGRARGVFARPMSLGLLPGNPYPPETERLKGTSCPNSDGGFIHRLTEALTRIDENDRTPAVVSLVDRSADT